MTKDLEARLGRIWAELSSNARIKLMSQGDGLDSIILALRRGAEALVCTSPCVDNYCPVHGIEASSKSRCEVHTTTNRMERQCVRDLNHTGKCEFGSWRNK